jgi:hypothetical protein
MAVRRPLYYDSGNLREMSDAQLTQVRQRVAYQYSLNPSVTLSQVASGGTLGTISDTRKTAGSYSVSATAFPSEAATAEPGTTTVNYARISEAVASTTDLTDTSNKRFPVFNNAGNIQAMSLTDMYDTFIYPAIDLLVSGSTGTDQGGTYRIHTATTLAGHTLVSATPVFSDTRADTSLYTAAGIPEALDQPTTITNFYLFRINGSAPSFTAPLYIRSDNNLQTYATATFDSDLQALIRHSATSKTGYQIRYSLNGTGTNRGSGMTDTRLDGAGNYQQLFVNVNDYRAQEFPNGTAVTINTYYLRIYKV